MTFASVPTEGLNLQFQGLLDIEYSIQNRYSFPPSSRSIHLDLALRIEQCKNKLTTAGWLLYSQQVSRVIFVWRE